MSEVVAGYAMVLDGQVTQLPVRPVKHADQYHTDIRRLRAHCKTSPRADAASSNSGQPATVVTDSASVSRPSRILWAALGGTWFLTAANAVVKQRWILVSNANVQQQPRVWRRRRLATPIRPMETTIPAERVAEKTGYRQHRHQRCSVESCAKVNKTSTVATPTPS